MKPLLSVRLSNKHGAKFLASHFFKNSHGRVVNSEPNALILESNGIVSALPYFRDSHDSKSDIYYGYLLSEYEKYEQQAYSWHQMQHGRKLRSDVKLCWDGVISFGNKEHNLSRSDLLSIGLDSLDHSASNFFIDFLESNGLNRYSGILVRHMDEAQIHYQFSFVGYDFDKFEPFRKRVTPDFLSKLQDHAARFFEKIGIGRGISKKERVDAVLAEKGLVRDDYNAMSLASKAELIKDANVKHKSVQKLHADLKDDYARFSRQLKNGQTLFDYVVNAKPQDIEELRKDARLENDRVLKRFFTYAMRIHNEKADSKKAVRHLQGVIDDLQKRRYDLEFEFREYYEKRFRQCQAFCDSDTSISYNSFLKDMRDLQEHANKLRDETGKQKIQELKQAFNQMTSQVKPQSQPIFSPRL